MTEQSPYERLGVSENATFEEIQAAKKLAIAQHRDDVKLMDNVEAAYDAILMERLKMRQQGKIKVPDDVRFGEKPQNSFPRSISSNLPQASGWFSKNFSRPQRSQLILSSSVYAGLMGVSAVPALAAQSLPLFLAMGIGFSLYAINNQTRNFRSALLWSLGAVVVGVTVGSIIANYTSVQIAQLGSSPEVLSALFGYLFLWAVSTFRN
jgi:hypothetical protein